MSSPLAALLGSFAGDAFRDQRHLVVHGSLGRLPAWFATGVLADPRELSRAYRGPVFVTNRTLGRFQVHGVEPRECFDELGLTVGFTEVEDLIPDAPDWLRALEADLGMPRGGATIAVFVNGRRSGLSVHCDPHEQIAIHLAGPKAFRLRAHPARFPCMKHVPGIAAAAHWLAQSAAGLLDEPALTEDDDQVDLRPGSVLVTPRGVYHETLAGDAIAMTAVIAFRNPTPGQMLTAYLDKVLLQAEDWRRPLDFAWSADPARREAAHARMGALLAQAASRIASLSVARVLASAEAGALDAGALRDGTRLVREPSTRVALRDDGGGRVRVEIELELGAGRAAACTLPGALRPLLEWLAAQRAPFTFGEACARFADWDRTAVASTIASLVRTHALVELPFEAW